MASMACSSSSSLPESALRFVTLDTAVMEEPDLRVLTVSVSSWMPNEASSSNTPSSSSYATSTSLSELASPSGVTALIVTAVEASAGLMDSARDAAGLSALRNPSLPGCLSAGTSVRGWAMAAS